MGIPVKRSPRQHTMLHLAAISPLAFHAPMHAAPSRVTMTAELPALTPGGAEYAKSMPGLGPFGFFDPLGTTEEKTVEEIMLYREAELAHGRVAMMASLGFLVQEAFHPIFAWVDGPAARQLDLVLSTENGLFAGTTLLMAIFFSEIARARIGWVEPEVEMRTLREGYLPGDLGFDPLGLKPKNDVEFRKMQDKELNNGRLAMIAVAGMCAQEVATNAPILGN